MNTTLECNYFVIIPQYMQPLVLVFLNANGTKLYVTALQNLYQMPNRAKKAVVKCRKLYTKHDRSCALYSLEPV